VRVATRGICSVLFSVFAACGGADGSAQSKHAAASALAVSYVPAAQTCQAMPEPAATVAAPIASVTSHISRYRVCGPFTATARLSSFECARPGLAAGPFRLLAYNGRPDSTGRVSSRRSR
jgi:hypothetical protein